MRKIKFLLIVLLVFYSIGLCATNTTTNTNNKNSPTETTKSVKLEDIITLIDKYLSQNSVNVQKLSADKEFQLKILAQKLFDKFSSSESFNTLAEMEKLIGNSEFKYDYIIFKTGTIYYFRARLLYYADDANSMFDQIVDFVMNRSKNKKEQWQILNALFDSYIESLDLENLRNFDNALKLYFVLSEYFYKADKKFFYESPFSTLITVATVETAVSTILRPIVNVAKNLSNKLSEDQKLLILKEAMMYIELEKSYPDEVVKIYYYLNK